MKVFLTTEAKLDIREASAWYDEKEKSLGRQFTATIRQEVNFIAKNPESVALRYKEIHTCVVSVFPYMIHYYRQHQFSDCRGTTYFAKPKQMEIIP